MAGIGSPEKRLKLKLNKAKSAVAKPSVRKFLGFSFTAARPPAHRRQAIDPEQGKSGAVAGSPARTIAQTADHLWLARLLRLLPTAGACAQFDMDQATVARRRWKHGSVARSLRRTATREAERHYDQPPLAHGPLPMGREPALYALGKAFFRSLGWQFASPHPQFAGHRSATLDGRGASEAAPIPMSASDYRPPGAGVRVEPLGEGLISVLPDGFRPLFAPAAELPALLDMPGLVPVHCPSSCRSREIRSSCRSRPHRPCSILRRPSRRRTARAHTCW